MRLDGKVALITGAGSGIGLAMARLFAREGARVVAVDIVVERLKQLEGVAGFDTVVADVSKSSDVDRMIGIALERHGKLDILCNNAGISDRRMQMTEVTEEIWERVLAVNLTAPAMACRRAIPIMIEAGGGVIINTASIAGLRGGRGGTAYTVAKHGLIGLTRNIAAAYGPSGIRCVALCPGGTQTRLKATPDLSEFGLMLNAKSAPSRPPSADPRAQANVALFLASDEASFVNGAIIVADGGWTAY